MTRSIPYPAMKSASRLLALIVGVLILCAVLPARAQYACTTNYCIRSQSLSVQTPPEWPAVALADAYLLFPPVQWLTVSDFHPVALATPLLLAAWYFLDADRLWPFALFAAAAIATKEHVGLAVAGLGAWYALDRRQIRAGVAIAAVAGGLALVAALVVVPTFAPAGSAFESRYEHTLVGPWPEAEAIYRERSAINFVDRISTPMLVLQGADDEVVPPAQAELIVAALRARGVPHAYLLFEGEGHGFRKAENIVRSLEAELSFYLQVLGLEPGDPLPKLEIEHLPS